MEATIFCGCGIYSLAKITTLVEICLSCNCLLFFEWYGIEKKKNVWVIVGIIYRFLAFIIQIALGIAFFSTDMLYAKAKANGQDVNFEDAEKIFRYVIHSSEIRGLCLMK